MLIYLLLVLSVRVRNFMRVWMPTNIFLDYLRTRRGGKRDGTALLVGASYLALAIGCARAVELGWPGWLYLAFWLFLWNASKFLLFPPIEAGRRRVHRLRAVRARLSQRLAAPDGASAQDLTPQQQTGVDYVGTGR
ncbi:sulfate permease [Microbacterium foliorum]|uniref:Sulfate permease n=1 Tax=Microbacterium esteraromaticum TaxID=57043 RepID=A0A1R4KBZ3_9MICO|nr:hypothetical protein [Microbacterium esteraromaticum]SJN41758.1 hypothetical protein FM104_11620 [Microbacterium esteraromaticum]